MPSAVAKRLGYALKHAQHAMRVAMDDALRALGMTMPQYAVLSAVEAEPGLSNARLARAAFVTPQTMQGVLANLERDGLLERHGDPHHGRILRSELTAKGRRLLTDAHHAVKAVEDRMVESFGGDDAARQMAEALSKCVEDLQRPRKAQDA
jgi:DNA-binding MarR family transcriptional regulator